MATDADSANYTCDLETLDIERRQRRRRVGAQA